jgi:hypothetical protein
MAHAIISVPRPHAIRIDADWDDPNLARNSSNKSFRRQNEQSPQNTTASTRIDCECGTMRNHLCKGSNFQMLQENQIRRSQNRTDHKQIPALFVFEKQHITK